MRSARIASAGSLANVQVTCMRRFPAFNSAATSVSSSSTGTAASSAGAGPARYLARRSLFATRLATAASAGSMYAAARCISLSKSPFRRASRPNSSMLMRIECTGLRRSWSSLPTICRWFSCCTRLRTAASGGVPGAAKLASSRFLRSGARGGTNARPCEFPRSLKKLPAASKPAIGRHGQEKSRVSASTCFYCVATSICYVRPPAPPDIPRRH